MCSVYQNTSELLLYDGGATRSPNPCKPHSWKALSPTAPLSQSAPLRTELHRCRPRLASSTGESVGVGTASVPVAAPVSEVRLTNGCSKPGWIESRKSNGCLQDPMQHPNPQRRPDLGRRKTGPGSEVDLVATLARQLARAFTEPVALLLVFVRCLDPRGRLKGDS